MYVDNFKLIVFMFAKEINSYGLSGPTGSKIERTEDEQAEWVFTRKVFYSGLL